MPEIKIPKKEWDIFSITYSAPVKCPRCGQVQYVHISEYGETYKKYFPEKEYDNVVTDHCDYCGETLIVEMENPQVDPNLELDVWYDVVSKSREEYLDAVKVYIQHLGDSDCSNVIIYCLDGWNQVIEHCCPTEICKEVVLDRFKILGISQRQDIPIKEEEDSDTYRVNEITSNTVYKVKVKNENSVFFGYNYAEITPYSPVLLNEDNFSEPWYHVVLHNDSPTETGVIAYCGLLDGCKTYLYDNFFLYKDIKL